ncbi:MAG: radical SAM protein [Anaeromyxobacter sp.]
MEPRRTENPPNPWLGQQVEWDDGPPLARVTLLEDATRSILSGNDSPDLPFRWSLNPYRGCLHACAYCYARPTHEYLGMGAGTDFDTRIVVKRRAPELLREAFERRSWRGETVAFSGGTDAWQPLEGSLRLTRGCLEVCAAYRNPVCLVTKSALLERDLDLLQVLHREARLSVAVSLPLLDAGIARALEPWAAAPERRLLLLRRLAEAGLEPAVLVAPVIPGLDDQLAQVLEAARAAGATRAGWALLRLPGPVAEVFERRLRAVLPERADRILHLVRETRGGALGEGRPGQRGCGTGPYAATIGRVFAVLTSRLGLEPRPDPDLGPSPFRRPHPGGQLDLFSCK